MNAAYVSWNTFALIVDSRRAGRDFVEADDRDGAAPVVIVGGSCGGRVMVRTRRWWERRFASPVCRPLSLESCLGDLALPDNADLWMPLVALPEE